MRAAMPALRVLCLTEATALELTPAAPISSNSVSNSDEQHIRSLWTALRGADKQFERAEKQLQKRGLEFGKALYEYRAKYSAQGRRTDLVSDDTKSETFEAFCDRMEIARKTVYRWINRYEESI